MNIFLFSGLVISVIANALLALYILIKKIKSPAAFYYFLFMVAVTLHVAGDLFFQLATTIPAARTAIYAYWAGFILLSALFFLFASNFPRSRKTIFQNESSKLFVLIIPLILIYLMFFSNDFIKNIVISDQGVNSVEYGSIYTLAVLHLIIFLTAAFSTLFIEYLKSNIESEKRNIFFVFIGVLIGSIIGLPCDVFILRALGFGELKITSILILIGCIIISYAVVQHKIFVITPVSEENSKEKVLFSAGRGKVYSFDEKNEARKRGFRIFANLVKHDRQGLLVSTTFPEQVRKIYSLPKTPIIWISDSAEAGEGQMNPKEIDILSRSIFSFMEKANAPIILLEGIRPLLIENGAEKTSEFLNALTKKAIETSATVFFSLKGKETEFVNLFSELSDTTTRLTDLNRKFYKREITEDVLFELVEELEKNSIQKQAKLKLIEEEFLGKLVGANELTLSKNLLELELQIINYKLAKRSIPTKVATNLTNSVQKELVTLEQQLKKKGIIQAVD